MFVFLKHERIRLVWRARRPILRLFVQVSLIWPDLGRVLSYGHLVRVQ